MAKRKKNPSRRQPTEPPTCNCILLCDDVLVSQGRGKHTLSGVIGTIILQGLPAQSGSFVAYIRLSNVYGSKDVQVSLLRADSNEPVFQFEAKLPDKTDPLGLYLLMVPIPPFKIERAGRYLFQAECDGEVLATSPISVVAMGVA